MYQTIENRMAELMLEALDEDRPDIERVKTCELIEIYWKLWEAKRRFDAQSS